MDLALPSLGPSLDLDKFLPDFTAADQDSFGGQFDFFLGQDARPTEAVGLDQAAFDGSSGGQHDPQVDAATSKHMSQKEKLRSKNRRQAQGCNKAVLS